MSGPKLDDGTMSMMAASGAFNVKQETAEAARGPSKGKLDAVTEDAVSSILAGTRPGSELDKIEKSTAKKSARVKKDESVTTVTVSVDSEKPGQPDINVSTEEPDEEMADVGIDAPEPEVAMVSPVEPEPMAEPEPTTAIDVLGLAGTGEDDILSRIDQVADEMGDEDSPVDMEPDISFDVEDEVEREVSMGKKDMPEPDEDGDEDEDEDEEDEEPTEGVDPSYTPATRPVGKKRRDIENAIINATDFYDANTLSTMSDDRLMAVYRKFVKEDSGSASLDKFAKAESLLFGDSTEEPVDEKKRFGRRAKPLGKPKMRGGYKSTVGQRMHRRSKGRVRKHKPKPITTYEGKDKPGERDGTGSYKGSYQAKTKGKARRKMAGKKCPFESGELVMVDVDGQMMEAHVIDVLEDTVQVELDGNVVRELPLDMVSSLENAVDESMVDRVMRGEDVEAILDEMTEGGEGQLLAKSGSKKTGKMTAMNPTRWNPGTTGPLVKGLKQYGKAQ